RQEPGTSVYGSASVVRGWNPAWPARRPSLASPLSLGTAPAARMPSAAPAPATVAVASSSRREMRRMPPLVSHELRQHLRSGALAGAHGTVHVAVPIGRRL